MMGHKEKLKSGAEYDVIFDRGIYCYLLNSTAAHKIKKQMTRRNRRQAKMHIYTMQISEGGVL